MFAAKTLWFIDKKKVRSINHKTICWRRRSSEGLKRSGLRRLSQFWSRNLTAAGIQVQVQSQINFEDSSAAVGATVQRNKQQVSGSDGSDKRKRERQSEMENTTTYEHPNDCYCWLIGVTIARKSNNSIRYFSTTETAERCAAKLEDARLRTRRLHSTNERNRQRMAQICMDEVKTYFL